MEYLTTFASILDEFFKNLSECGLMTCYSVQLQSNITSVGTINKFKIIIQELVKKLEILLASIPSVQSSEASTQTTEDLEDLEGRCHSVSQTPLPVSALSIKSLPMVSNFQSGGQQQQRAREPSHSSCLVDAVKPPAPALVCHLGPLVLETDKSFPQLLRIQPPGQQEGGKVKMENIVQIVVETPTEILRDFPDNASEASHDASSEHLSGSGCDDPQQEQKEEPPNHQNMQFHTHICDMCEKVFNCVQSLQEHCRREHNGVGCFKCGLCDKRFMTKLSLNRHMDAHEGKKDAICNVCGKSFSRADYLRTHYSIHLGKRNFSCSQCPRKFVRKMHLKAHEKIHSGVKDHVCKVCNKGFARSDKLKEHMMRHLNIKRFHCPLCPRDYTEKRDLKLHLKSHSK